jgi:PucR family transcriptional regulator, purine catabolism regulatory protein
MLWILRDEAVARAFVASRLQPLIDADERRGSSLLTTLEAFVISGDHKADSARVLNVERQSLYKRQRRIQEITGADLDDPRTRLELHLAVLARRFFERASDR